MHIKSKVYGPPEQEISSLSKLNTSNQTLYNVFIGTAKPFFVSWNWVDVRDLAQAHVGAIVCSKVTLPLCRS